MKDKNAEFRKKVIDWLKESPRTHEDVAQKMQDLSEQVCIETMKLHHFNERSIILKGIFAPIKTGFE